MRHLPLALVTLCLIACQGDSAPSPSVEVSDIAVKDFGADAGGEFCSDFRMNDEQARSFFARAVAVDADKLHELDVLPCYVRGTARTRGEHATWTIRAGGTAELKTSTGVELLSCTTCDDLFGGESR